MSTIDVVTWAGTAFSILGAGIAIWQAIQAKSAAASAERMRDEIAGKHAQSDLSALDAILSTAWRAMEKYGPGSTAISRRGSSPRDDATAVQRFTAEMARHRELLTATFGDPCDDVRTRIDGLLIQFSGAATDAARTPFGAQVYQEIATFSGNMKHAVDAKVFGAPPTRPPARFGWAVTILSVFSGPRGYRAG